MSAALENRIVDENVAASLPAERLAIRLRLYNVSQRIVEGVLFRARRLIEALHAGFWLGVLDRDQINAVVFRHYDEADLYRTAAHNLHGFLPYEKEIIRDHFGGCRSVVVAAAGGGREMIALARLGKDVEGFECNLRLVNTCKDFLAQAGVTARIIQAQPDHIPAGLKTYDGAIVGWGAYSHIVGRTTRINFLKGIKHHLHSGAPLFLAVGRRPRGSSYYALIYRIGRVVRTLRGSTGSIEFGDDLLDCFSHRFTESELSSELREAGYNIIECVETHELYAVAQLDSD